MSPHLNIVICGHIDHGKSTLIGRLLIDTRSLPEDRLKELQKIAHEFGQESQIAYLSDQLKEERERNITIETTQHFIRTSQRHYNLIDTPGHLEFITNMLTGASRADAALLLIDITEGIQEQTRRHAYLLKFLSIPQILVLINKMDAIQYSENQFQNISIKIKMMLAALNIKNAHIIPIAAKAGANVCQRSHAMPWYEGPCLTKALDTLPTLAPQTSPHLRLPIQDVYNIDDENIIVGRIISGTLQVGQKIAILPQSAYVTIKELKAYGSQKSSARQHENIGLILKENISTTRGNILCSEIPIPRLTKRFMGNIIWLHASPLNKGQTLKLRCATQELQCTILRICNRINSSSLETLEEEANQLYQNEAGLIEFELTESGLMENFRDYPELGRYTIENDQSLLGAGTVLQKDI